MFTAPPEMVALLACFAPVFFQQRVWCSAQILLWGTILAHGRRTVTSALRAVGLSNERHFTTYHRVLNRSRWAMLESARLLLTLLLATFLTAEAVVVVAIDDTIERRRSDRLYGLGAYRDPVRSSGAKTVFCFGLRWLVASLCVWVPGASRVWALPFLSILCQPPHTPGAKTSRAKTTPTPTPKPERRAQPSRRGMRGDRMSTAKRPLVGVRRRKTSIDLAGQVLTVLRRWLPERQIVAVLDGAFCSYKLLRHAQRVGVDVVTRGLWTMVLYDEPAPRAAGGKGAAPSRGARQGTLRERLEDPATQWETKQVAWYGGTTKTLEVASGTGRWSNDERRAILVRWVMTRDPEPDQAKRLPPEVFVTTQMTATPEQIVAWYVWRWSTEATFEEAREHLGIQTQRQASRRALERTTPALFGLFSIVTLLAVTDSQGQVPRNETAWYTKPDVTFSDCLAYVRRRLWRHRYSPDGDLGPLTGKIDPDVLDQVLDALPLIA